MGFLRDIIITIMKNIILKHSKIWINFEKSVNNEANLYINKKLTNK